MADARQAAGTMVLGKVVAVTGGSTGIGEAVCKLFARNGAKVVVNGLPGDPVDAVVSEIRADGGDATACVADASTLQGAQVIVRAAVENYGRLDCLIANAGHFPEQFEVQEFPVEMFDELLRSNIWSVFHTVRAALPELQKTKGVVLAAGSEAGLHGLPEAVCYGASKGWIIAFIRGVAAEQAKYGVRANVVAPGPIDTEMTRAGKGNMSVKTALMAPRTVALGRRGTPEEVANVYLFLASDLASFVTGSVYPVDGGSTAAAGLPGLEARAEAKATPEGTIELRHQFEGRKSRAG